MFLTHIYRERAREKEKESERERERELTFGSVFLPAAALGLSQEVGIITVTDLVAKLGFGLYFLFNFDDVMGEEGGEEGMNQQSQQYV